VDDDLDHLVYIAMSWNTPLDDDHAQRLLDALDVAAARSVVDLGCGWGELLLRAVAAGPPGCHGIGVDTDEPLLARGREAAQARGLQELVRFVDADATSWRLPAEVVLCVGAAHAWPGGGDRRRLAGDVGQRGITAGVARFRESLPRRTRAVGAGPSRGSAGGAAGGGDDRAARGVRDGLPRRTRLCLPRARRLRG
jgi:SAM-dependent methyltransferase